MDEPAQGSSHDEYDINAQADPAGVEGDNDFTDYEARLENLQTKTGKQDTEKEKPDPQPSDEPPDEAAKSAKKSDFVPPDQGGSEFKEDDDADDDKYKPDLKFNVQGKQFEFDEFIHPLITSKEIEDKVRDIYTKAHGLDASKQYNQQLIEQFAEKTQVHEDTAKKYTTITDDITFMKEMLSNGDYLGYARAVGFTDDLLEKLAQQAVSYKKMDPYQQSQYDQSLRSRRDVYMKSKNERELENKLNAQMQQISEINARQTLQFIDSTLEKPDYSTFAQEFDARIGEKGAFRKEVVYLGDRREREGGSTDIGDLISHLAKVYGLGGMMTNQSSKAAGKVVSPEKVQQRQQTIPNLKGSAASSVRKPVGSIADLKKMAVQQGLFPG